MNPNEADLARRIASLLVVEFQDVTVQESNANDDDDPRVYGFDPKTDRTFSVVVKVHG